MTSTEKVVLKWYTANPFMYNKNDDRFYTSEMKNDVLLKIQEELFESKAYLSGNKLL